MSWFSRATPRRRIRARPDCSIAPGCSTWSEAPSATYIAFDASGGEIARGTIDTRSEGWKSLFDRDLTGAASIKVANDCGGSCRMVYVDIIRATPR